MTWEHAQEVVIIVGLTALVIREVVLMVVGSCLWARHTEKLWFGPLRAYLATRRRSDT